MIALHVSSVAQNIYVLAVISCGTDYQCDDNKYCTPSVQNLIDVCITGKASVNNTEWVSSTCYSNLSDEKANKMNFPVKPECLNFTPLEERLKSLCISFTQIILCILSIHSNVVNVPADVNSVVNTLPKTLEVPLSVSQC